MSETIKPPFLWKKADLKTACTSSLKRGLLAYPQRFYEYDSNNWVTYFIPTSCSDNHIHNALKNCILSKNRSVNKPNPRILSVSK